MTHITPYSFPTEFVPSIHTQATPGQTQGVYVMLHPDSVDDITDKMYRWFEARPEVVIINVGTSDKRGFGFLILEWMECAVDPLFLSILQTEAFAADYTTYIRILQHQNNEGV